MRKQWTMLAVAAAFNLSWSGAASAQKPSLAKPPAGKPEERPRDARRLLDPQTESEKRLSKLWEQVLRAHSDAEFASSYCRPKELQDAQQRMEKLLEEARLVSNAATGAKGFGSTDPDLARWVYQRASELAGAVRNWEARGCPEAAKATPKSSPTGEPKASTGDLTRYRPAPASADAVAKYAQDVETEFANVQDARERRNCSGWEQAMARLAALLNDYRANVTGAASPGNRVIWADRYAREEANKPACLEVEPR